MPAPWRPKGIESVTGHFLDFNLKRDASPVATWKDADDPLIWYEFQSQARCQPRGDYNESWNMAFCHTTVALIKRAIFPGVFPEQEKLRAIQAPM